MIFMPKIYHSWSDISNFTLNIKYPNVKFKSFVILNLLGELG